MVYFLSGMITAGFLIASLFFFRFCRRTGDALFFVFGVSFVLFAMSHASALLSDAPRDDRTWVYLLRLSGFALLLIGIFWKNFGKTELR